MASEDVGALVARVVADTENFRSEMAKMGQRIDSATGRMNRSLSTVDRNLKSLRGGFGLVTKAAAAFGVALSVRGLTQFAARQIEAANSMAHLANRLGTTTEALSELGYVAKLADVETNVLTLGLQRMTRRIAEAAQGSGEARGALRELGLDARALAAAPLDRQFEAIADELSKVTNESDRVRLAMKLFDSEGVALIQTMQGGATEIRRLRNEARDLGITLDSQAAKRAQEAQDAMDRMKSSVGALARDLTLTLAPALEEIANKMREAFFPTEQENANRMLEERQRAVEEAAQAHINYLNSVTRGGRTLEDLHPAERSHAERLAEAYKTATRNLEEFQRMQKFIAETSGASGASVLGGSVGSSGDSALTPIEVGPTPLSVLLDEIDQRAMAERDYTTFLEQQQQARVQAAASAAAEETQLVLDSQMQQLEFRSAMASAAAQLALGLFGQHKAIQLAAIAFEKLAAVRRVKLATDVAAWQAFQSQLIPGDPTSLGRANAAYAAVKARGAATLAQTVALSVVSGLAEAANVVGSSGQPGSFTNPVFTSRGLQATSSVAGGGGRVEHKRRVVEVNLTGTFYGWDSYIREQVISGIRDAVDNGDVILIRGDSANGELLRGRV